MRRTEVFKFGGTSVADAARIHRVAELIAAAPEPPVVVVSAMAGVTDRLVALAGALGAPAPTTPPETGGGGGARRDPHELVQELRTRHHEVIADLDPGTERSATLAREVDDILSRVERVLERVDRGDRPAAVDRVLAAGEDLSSRLVVAALQASGVPAALVDPRRVVRTDARFGRARPLDDHVRRLAAESVTPLLDEGRVPVLGGFVGATSDGRTTTLGRGGSDFTAAILGAALDAQRVRIWTDVPGILSGDPAAVDDPVVLRKVGFEEAVELAYFGARVIHPTAAKYAVARGVPLQIRNTFDSGDPGTDVLPERWGAPHIAAVAFKPDVVLIKVRSHPAAMPYGFLARVFEILARHRLPVDLVATSHSSTAFTIDENEEIDAVSVELSAFADVDVVRDLATVTVVGHGLMEEPGVNGRVFEAVGRTPVHLISQASDVSLSLVVASADAARVVRTLHASMVETRAPARGPAT